MDKQQAYDIITNLTQMGLLEGKTFKFMRKGQSGLYEYTCSNIAYIENAGCVLIEWSMDGDYRGAGNLENFVDWFVVSLCEKITESMNIDRNLF